MCGRASAGQALIEMMGGLIALCVLFLVSFYIISHYWVRAWCAYAVFEYTHSYLLGGNPRQPKSHTRIDIQDFRSHIEGTGRCGKVKEKIIFPKLENAQW